MRLIKQYQAPNICQTWALSLNKISNIFYSWSHLPSAVQVAKSKPPHRFRSAMFRFTALSGSVLLVLEALASSAAGKGSANEDLESRSRWHMSYVVSSRFYIKLLVPVTWVTCTCCKVTLPWILSFLKPTQQLAAFWGISCDTMAKPTKLQHREVVQTIFFICKIRDICSTKKQT